MGSFSSLAQGSRWATAATAPSAAPRTSVAAAATRDGFRTGVVLRPRVAAPRAAAFRFATVR